MTQNHQFDHGHSAPVEGRHPIIWTIIGLFGVALIILVIMKPTTDSPFTAITTANATVTLFSEDSTAPALTSKARKITPLSSYNPPLRITVGQSFTVLVEETPIRFKLEGVNPIHISTDVTIFTTVNNGKMEVTYKGRKIFQVDVRGDNIADIVTSYEKRTVSPKA